MASVVQVVDRGAASVGRHAGSGGLAAFAVHDERSRSLSALIEREIIPRLVVAHAVAPPTDAPAGTGRVVTPADVEMLAAEALRLDADTLMRRIEAVVARGFSVDALLVDLLAPVARLLGTWWEEDRCDFLDVTMGLWRLQEAVHELAARHPPRRPLAAGGRRALFASMPGDQHGFGTIVVDELFRHDGWITERMLDAATPELLRRVADGWFDLIGLTISRECDIAAATSLIVGLRNVSRNPRVCVMVGGRVFSADADLATLVGADGTAGDAKVALRIASGLVGAREREAAACN